MPTIEDDGFILWEANSCVRYIAAKFGAGTLWPTDLRQRADAERWMDWQLTTLSAPGWTIFLGLVLTKPERRDMAAIAAATQRSNELWTIVDKVLATRKFVAGGQLTITLQMMERNTVIPIGLGLPSGVFIKETTTSAPG